MQAPYPRLFDPALRAAVAAFLYSTLVICLPMGQCLADLREIGCWLLALIHNKLMKAAVSPESRIFYRQQLQSVI